MKKNFLRHALLVSLIIFFYFLFLTKDQIHSQSQERYATCDLCGYCQPNPPPDNWLNCKNCLYPNASDNPDSKDTLRINPTTNLPPTPVPGRQYTLLGCIGNTGLFREQSGVAGVVQFILNVIFSLVGGVSFLYLLYGVFVLMTSAANPERVNYGKRVISGSIIGLIFTLLSLFIFNLISQNFLGLPRG
ncbi:MAG: pilin [Patescibacteria group bacterium]|nr:pilin [Patescibacteria group bacterium]